MIQLDKDKAPTYTPLRLKKALQNGQSIEVPFILGGWIYPSEEGFLLTGQGVQIMGNLRRPGKQSFKMPGTFESTLENIEPGSSVFLKVSNWCQESFVIRDCQLAEVPHNANPQLRGSLSQYSPGSNTLSPDSPLIQNFHNYAKWSQFQLEVRKYFQGAGLFEVSTPSLVVTPAVESELVPFKTSWKFGKRSGHFYLPTSPEVHLKKILSSGFTDIFEIKECFRNEEVSPVHEPHFLMLEWYRAFADLKIIKQDLIGLIEALLERGLVLKPPSQIQSFTMAELFKKFVDFNLTPETTLSELKSLAQKLNIELPLDIDWNDCFFFIFVEKIELHFKDLGAFFLTDYPPSMSALAKINQEGFADRFEFYWQGVEIANAFNELQDPKEQVLRFERENQKRVEKGEEPLHLDPEFIQSLERGLPQTGGIALGMERLFMACQGLKKISEFKSHTFAD